MKKNFFNINIHFEANDLDKYTATVVIVFV